MEVRPLDNAYETLGLPRDVSAAQARRTYRQLVRELHPDTGAGDVARLTAVRQAYREIERAAPASGDEPPRPRLDVRA
jgi:curved DNA-binding protein CbpA